MNVTIVDQPELRVAGIRHIGPYTRSAARSGVSAASQGATSARLADDRGLSRRPGVDGH